MMMKKTVRKSRLGQNKQLVLKFQRLKYDGIKRENRYLLRGGYEKGSKQTQMRHHKSIRDFEKEASKTYNLQAHGNKVKTWA